MLFKYLKVTLVILLLSLSAACNVSADYPPPLTVAAERPDLYLPDLNGKRVGVIVNQSSIAYEQHLVDYLRTEKVNVTAIFSPEHGFRGDKGAGEKIDTEIDSATGLPVFSLYGKTRKPTAEMLESVDVLIFDIQDVGVRFYTYISTLHYVMEAASELNKMVIVLDRPNPNIMYVDGPILEPEFKSFVGMHPIPVLHGMTVAEIALMIKGEKWIENADKLALKVIPVENYSRSTSYSLPIRPSPNLPNDLSIKLYPSLCFFEPTAVSIGRGTAFPFQVIGHDSVDLGGFNFTPRSMPESAPSPKLQDILLSGRDLRGSAIQGLDLALLFETYKNFKRNDTAFFTSESFFDKLAGTASLREALIMGKNIEEVKQSWQQPLRDFKSKRKDYLLYSDRI